MSELAIKVEKLYKQYSKGKRANNSLRESLSNIFTTREKPSLFWALQDINFEVQKGEVIGIIGVNGAGKSTLLKLLSRITYPTKGKIEINGKIASLLEVGTGFHPELTGRENIFLNGAILGMTRSEIYRVFDEIVDFSGVESFLDTPVKRYSSGMYVRLAFSVAAHLRSDILLIDEVLSVGDILFQKKCYEKINSVSNTGKSAILVSHNLASITKFCNSSFILDKGLLSSKYPSNVAISKYYHLLNEFSESKPKLKGPISSNFELINTKIIDPNNSRINGNNIFEPNQEIKIIFNFNTNWVNPFRIRISIFSNECRLFSFHDGDFRITKSKTFESEFILPNFMLRPGIYGITVSGYSDYSMNLWFSSDIVSKFRIIESYTEHYEKNSIGMINIKDNMAIKSSFRDL